MKEMQDVNPDKETASNAQIMFLVLNAAGLTIIPVSIIVYRTQLGAVNPADIFIPILISTFVASLTGMIKCCNYPEDKSFRQGHSCISWRTYCNYCRYNILFQQASQRNRSLLHFNICCQFYSDVDNSTVYCSCLY